MKNTAWRVLCLLFGFVAATYLSSVFAADPTITALQSQIATLQKDVTVLKSALAETQSALKKEVSDTSLRFQKLESVIQVGSTVTIESAGGLVLKSAGTIAVNGALIKLNGGSKPVATVGSTVTGGVVTTGSSTVLVQ